MHITTCPQLSSFCILTENCTNRLCSVFETRILSRSLNKNVNRISKIYPSWKSLDPYLNNKRLKYLASKSYELCQTNDKFEISSRKTHRSNRFELEVVSNVCSCVSAPSSRSFDCLSDRSSSSLIRIRLVMQNTLATCNCSLELVIYSITFLINVCSVISMSFEILPFAIFDNRQSTCYTKTKIRWKFEDLRGKLGEEWKTPT